MRWQTRSGVCLARALRSLDSSLWATYRITTM